MINEYTYGTRYCNILYPKLHNNKYNACIMMYLLYKQKSNYNL